MIAVDSPPGITSPSSPSSCSGLRTSTDVGAELRAASRRARGSSPAPRGLRFSAARPPCSILVSPSVQRRHPHLQIPAPRESRNLHQIRPAPPRGTSKQRGRQLWHRQAGSCVPKEALGRRAGAPARAHAPRPGAILVVDDERSVPPSLPRESPAPPASTCSEADDGETALELARREQPDLILLDVMMPGPRRVERRPRARQGRANAGHPRRLPHRSRRPPTGGAARSSAASATSSSRADPAQASASARRRRARADRSAASGRAPARHRVRARAMSVHERGGPRSDSSGSPTLLAEAVTAGGARRDLTEGVRAAEARAGAIGVLSPDARASGCSLSRAIPARSVEDWGRFPVSARLPMSQVVRTGSLCSCRPGASAQVLPELCRPGSERRRDGGASTGGRGRVFRRAWRSRSGGGRVPGSSAAR